MTDTNATETTTPQPSAQEIGERGKAIYTDKIRPTLSEADKGKYITINTETGEWLMDADREQLLQKTSEKFPYFRGAFYTLRAGWRASVSFRPGLNRELVEW